METQSWTFAASRGCRQPVAAFECFPPNSIPQRPKHQGFSALNGCIGSGLVLGLTSLTKLNSIATSRRHSGNQCVRGLRTCHHGLKEECSTDMLHRPLEGLSRLALLSWSLNIFEVANKDFFKGRLEAANITIDETWHSRGGAGGAHVSTNRIVLDPSVHTCCGDLCGTLLHEMLHLQVGEDDGEEHGPRFLKACLELNNDLLASGTGLFCRLGEFDTALDQRLLLEAGVPQAVSAALLKGLRESGETWDSGLLASDLFTLYHNSGSTHIIKKDILYLAARLRCLSIANSCQIALKTGYTSWSLKSRTIARHFAVAQGRDYHCYSDYNALWSV